MWKFDVNDKIVGPLFVIPIILIWYLFKSTGFNVCIGWDGCDGWDIWDVWFIFGICLVGDIETCFGGDVDPKFLFCRLFVCWYVEFTFGYKATLRLT